MPRGKHVLPTCIANSEDRAYLAGFVDKVKKEKAERVLSLALMREYTERIRYQD